MLRAAEVLLREGDAESAVGRAYYAMLHAAQALLREQGLAYRKHSGVHAAFGENFAKTGILDPKYHRWMLAAFDARLKGDYDFEATIDEATVRTIFEQAREFVAAVGSQLGADEQ
jgi:uncharacterized protein (UPF0332 family)